MSDIATRPVIDFQGAAWAYELGSAARKSYWHGRKLRQECAERNPFEPGSPHAKYFEDGYYTRTFKAPR